MPVQLLGLCLALSAAALNASIGIFSKVLIERGFSPAAIAFYKTILAVGLLSVALLIAGKRQVLKASGAKWWQAALCALLGIFTLFFFETKAYQYENAATVVVVLMASASVSSIILARIVLKDAIDLDITLGALLAVLGVYLIFKDSMGGRFNWQGVFYSAVAGLGYGSFSVCMKKMNILGGLLFTRALLFWGAVYLFIPASLSQELSVNITVHTALLLLALAVLPTILGFYCTTKAIQILKPSQVQVIELSEPLFAAVMAFLIFHEIPNTSTLYGGASILLGLLFANGLINIKKFSR